jgi:gamma-glutamylcyclotransferase (GGCT)/AIG2-like uncharacterized protein YtfP
MKKNDLLFVYGTLRVGESADLSANTLGEYLGEDCINGLIYNLGWYPGVVTQSMAFDPGKPAVRGDVFRIGCDSMVGQLDSYEGYPNLYDRIETMTAGGLHVWVYTYNHDVNPDNLIASGDWKNKDGNMLASPCQIIF